MDIISKEIFNSNDKLKSTILLRSSTDRLNTLKDSNTQYTFDDFVQTEKSEYLLSNNNNNKHNNDKYKLFKKEPIKASDLKSKAFRTSLGIVPLRQSDEFHDLNVILKGKTLVSSKYPEPPLNTINEKQQVYDNIHVNTPATDAYLDSINKLIKQQQEDERLSKKPAILPNNGTLSLKPLEKPKKQKVQVTVPIPKTQKSNKDQIAKSAATTNAYTTDSQTNFGGFDTNSNINEFNEIDDVKNLIEEAKLFTQYGAQKTFDSTNKSIKSPNKSINEIKSSAKTFGTINSNEKILLKNVETLIGAIRSGDLIKEQELSDKRIEEILNKVLDRPFILNEQENVNEVSDINEIKSISKPSIESVLSNTTSGFKDTVQNELIDNDDSNDGQNELTQIMDLKRSTISLIKDEEKSIVIDSDYKRPDSTEYLALLPEYVTREDVTRIDGKRAALTLIEKEPIIKKQRINKSYNVEDTQLNRNVHTFCLVNEKTEYLLPKELINATRKYHNLRKYNHQQQDYLNDSSQIELQTSSNFELYRRTNEAAKRILKSLNEFKEDRRGIKRENDDLVVDGKHVFIEDDYNDMLLSYLKPSPPKMCLKQSKIKDTLFPDYISNGVIDEEKEKFDKNNDDQQTEEDNDEDDLNNQINILKNKLINRKWNSDLFLDKLEEPLRIERSYSDNYLNNNNKNKIVNFIPIDSNYNDAVQEAYNQKEMLKQYDQFIKENGINDPNDLNIAEQEILKSYSEIQSKSLIFSEDSKYFPKNKKSTLAEEALKAGRSYVINIKDTNNTNSKNYKNLNKLNVKTIEELENFLFNYESANLERSESVKNLRYWRQMEQQFFISKTLRKKNRASLPDLLNFNAYQQERNYDEERVKKDIDQEDCPIREWIRGIWNEWFDEVFPLSESEKKFRSDLLKSRSKKTSTEQKQDEEDTRDAFIKDEDDDDDDESISVTSEDLANQRNIGESGALKKALHSANVYEKYDKVEITNKTKLDSKLMRDIENEISELTKRIEVKFNAFDLCRRGCLFRKLGMLKLALNDLTQVIELESNYIDAYWNRHLIYLAQNKKEQALNDLNTILKLRKTHAGAYLSRGDLCADKFETSMAIVNYSQAIKYEPNNYLAYYKRAQMYETNGDIIMAMDDYSTTTKLNPKISEAWFKHGMNYYNNKNYEFAIHDFTELLKHDPSHSKARLYRGKSYLSLFDYNQAFNDFSTAIHLDPNNWQAYYHRGCILRKLDVKQSLNDLSISLMIDNSFDNINAYLHRAILYCENNQYNEAIKDYEAVLQLDKLFASAHVNLGIIYMNVMVNYWKAIKCFTEAIKASPTYLRAYLCRAKAYHTIHDLKRAYLDYTKAIHLDPMRAQLYICRGKIILEMGDYKLAAFCVQHASFLKQDKSSASIKSNSTIERDQSYTQKAVVFSFLKDYPKAINVLITELKSKPNTKTYNLLGKTYMNSKEWKNAVDTFKTSIEYNKINTTNQSKRTQANKQLVSFGNENDLIEAYFMKGQCLIELKEYEDACACFNKVLELKPKYTQAYYYRGLSKAYMHHPKCILDLNRALALKSDYYEAYLARASVYGIQKRYAKAILNCNEALKINLKCVRAYLYRGTLKFYNKSYKSAIDDFTETIKLNQKCSLAYYNRAICNHHIMKVNDALRDYSIVLLLSDYLKFNVCINRGLLYYKMSDYSNALDDFKQASFMKPQDIKIKHILGLCYHKLNKLYESIKVLSETISSSSSSSSSVDANNELLNDVQVSRANVYVDFGHEKGLLKALSDYQHVLIKDPKHINARINLAYVLQMNGNFMNSWKQFTQCISLYPKFAIAYEGRSIVCLKMKDFNAALKDINQAIRISPKAELFVNRGVINQFLGDNINSMRDYQAAILADPFYSLAYYNSANIFLLSKQYQQALFNYNKCIQQCNLHDETVYQNRAIVHTILGNYTQALNDFNNALKYNKYSASIYMNRGLLLFKLKCYKDADNDFTHAIQLTKYDSLLYKLRGDCRAKLKLNDDAMNDFKMSINLYDKNFILVKS